MQSIMEKYFDEIVASTVEILKFDSSLKPAEENCPFGKEAADCLQYFLNLASEMGFETNNYDNYVGEVVFGEGKEFAILAHLDVVPAGSGWKYPPFGGVINDEPSEGGVTGRKIWGRGAMDDKTPAIVCLYALKALKDEGVLPTRKIKLIVGCNEEAGWKCIEHYNQVAQMPEEGFTPDANFPVIYAEKGILHFTMSFPINEAPMYGLNAGERVNMVCADASAFLTRKAAGKLVYYENPVEGTRLSYDNTTSILRAYGKSAHGSTPALGANALQAMLCFFASFNEDCKKAYDLLFNDLTGLKALEDETGVLTMSPDVASFKDGVLKITTDIRFPSTFPLETITAKLDEFGVEYNIDNYQAPLYNDPNGKLISTLVGVYNEITGKNETPIAIGGGTYARALKCGCAFGPEINGEEATIHQANEYVTFNRIRLMSEVYYGAIQAICTEAPATETEPSKKTRIAVATTLCRKVGETMEAEETEPAEEPTPSNKIRIAVTKTVCRRAGEMVETEETETEEPAEETALSNKTRIAVMKTTCRKPGETVETEEVTETEEPAEETTPSNKTRIAVAKTTCRKAGELVETVASGTADETQESQETPAVETKRGVLLAKATIAHRKK